MEYKVIYDCATTLIQVFSANSPEDVMRYLKGVDADGNPYLIQSSVELIESEQQMAANPVEILSLKEVTKKDINIDEIN